MPCQRHGRPAPPGRPISFLNGRRWHAVLTGRTYAARRDCEPRLSAQISRSLPANLQLKALRSSCLRLSDKSGYSDCRHAPKPWAKTSTVGWTVRPVGAPDNARKEGAYRRPRGITALRVLAKQSRFGRGTVWGEDGARNTPARHGPDAVWARLGSHAGAVHVTVSVLSRITFLAPPQPIRSPPRFPGRGASLRVRCGPKLATPILFAFRDVPQGLSVRR